MTVSDNQRKIREVLGIGRIEPPAPQTEETPDQAASQAEEASATQAEQEKADHDAQAVGMGAYATAEVHPPPEPEVEESDHEVSELSEEESEE